MGTESMVYIQNRLQLSPEKEQNAATNGSVDEAGDLDANPDRPDTERPVQATAGAYLGLEWISPGTEVSGEELQRVGRRGRDRCHWGQRRDEQKRPYAMHWRVSTEDGRVQGASGDKGQLRGSTLAQREPARFGSVARTKQRKGEWTMLSP